MFSPTTYYERRKDLADFVSKGMILLLGNEYSSMNYKDNVYPFFRQDSSFLYYIGLDKPGLAAIIDAESGETFLFGNEPTMDSMVWTGPEPALAELGERAAITQVLPIETLSEFIKITRSQERELHYLPTYRPEHIIKLSSLLNRGQKALARGVSLTLIQAIIHQRSIKSLEEIAELDKAVSISAQMHLHAMRNARPGMLEAELMAQVQAIPVSMESHPSFPIIMSIQGEILHNHHYHNRLAEGRLLLVDCGAEAPSHYAGDMTRTYPVSSAFTQKQKEVYQIVVDASDQVVINLRPGIPYLEMHKLASRTVAEGLKSLGIMKGDVEAAVEMGAHALFFPHGLGHMMGLDVHDMENLGEDLVGYNDEVHRSPQFGLKSLRLAKELQEGNVLTVEPGIYFIPGLIDQWKSENKFEEFINYEALESYRDFGGIRLEDDYVITATGSQLLGTAVPRTVEEVEEVRLEALS